MNNIILSTALLSSFFITSISGNEAERGEMFYEFNDLNETKEIKSSRQTSKKLKDSNELLEELLKVAKEQRDIQKDIYKLLKEELHPTPKMITVNGIKCIENSGENCFKMPLTKQAQKIPVLKELLTNPTVETAKEWLLWYAKYMNTGPLKVGSNFQYAMNTYGDKAYPINLNRGDVNSVDGKLKELKENAIKVKLNKYIDSNKLGIYIFLGSSALDYFSINEIGKIIFSIKNKKGIKLLFKTNEELESFKKSTQATADLREQFKAVSMDTNKKAFEINNIYMTPSYLAVSDKSGDKLKQVVSIGRVSRETLYLRVYEWLENKEIVKRGGLSDYKIWNIEEFTPTVKGITYE